MPNDSIACRNVLKDFADVFAEHFPITTTVGTSRLCGPMRLDISWQMLRQWATLRPTALKRLDTPGQINNRGLQALGNVQLFELKLELFNLNAQLLRLLTKEHALELCDE
mgnify:CR=1 FL=1